MAAISNCCAREMEAEALAGGGPVFGVILRNPPLLFVNEISRGSEPP